MVRGAESQEVVGDVPAAIETRRQVMNIDEGRVPAAWDSAPLAVAAKHGAAEGGWNGLRRAGASWRRL